MISFIFLIFVYLLGVAMIATAESSGKEVYMLASGVVTHGLVAFALINHS